MNDLLLRVRDRWLAQRWLRGVATLGEHVGRLSFRGRRHAHGFPRLDERHHRMGPRLPGNSGDGQEDDSGRAVSRILSALR